MSIRRFTELAHAHGAARKRWPEHERVLYDRFATSEAGRTILADAERVDRLLDAWQQPGDSGDDDGRVARIVAAAEQEHAGRQPVRPDRVPPRRQHLGTWLSTGFLASALFGFVLGFAQVDTGGEDPAYTELLLGSSTLEEFP